MLLARSDLAAPSPSGLALLGPLAFATWALSHAYLGLFHDAGLYALQALARIHPDTVSSDVFLRFGSQDRFTVFSPVFAFAARSLGLEPAAAALTLASQLGVLAAAWALARAVLPGSMAILGVAFLLAFPGDYGASRIFACIEPFLTPRMAAEAWVLAALALALRDARLLAGLCVAAALAVHPLMGMAGVAALFCLTVGERKPIVAVALAIVALKALILLAFCMPTGSWGQFDAEWLTLVRVRSPYLFLRYWTWDDWSRVAVTLSTLCVGMLVLPPARARLLCKISVTTGCGGVALTLIACDLLHMVALTQLQPWRWLWLSVVVAAVLLPEIIRVLWGRGTPGRSAALLLLAGWLFAANAYALTAVAAALLAALFLQRLKPSESRWIFLGAVGLLVIAGAWRLATNLEFTDAHYVDLRDPLWLRRTASFARDGSAPAAIFVLAWWVARQTQQRAEVVHLTLIALAAGCCAAVLPYTLQRWTAHDYSAQRMAQFEELRRNIPPHSSVFWPEAPLGVWILLDRPSYLSVMQTSGLVFSRPSALELQRRAAALKPAVDPSAFLSWHTGVADLTLSEPQLAAACSTGAFDFLVTRADLGVAAIAEIAAASASAAAKIRLYRCSQQAG